MKSALPVTTRVQSWIAQKKTIPASNGTRNREPGAVIRNASR
jgi:hypothetical protein